MTFPGLPGSSREFRYELTYLGAGETGGSISAALNNRGEVVGSLVDVVVQESGAGTLARRSFPFVWRDGQLERLPTPTSAGGDALGINDSGDVVGWAFEQGGPWQATLWRGGELRRLFERGRAFAINDRGEVVGRVEAEYRGELGVHWTVDGARFLQDGDGDFLGGLFSINDRGEFVGWTSSRYDPPLGVYHHDGRVNRLGTHLRDINGQSVIVGGLRVGTGTGPSLVTVPYLWRGTTSGRRLDTGCADCGGEAVAINEGGDVVGWVHPPSSSTTRTPVLWSEGRMVRLDDAVDHPEWEIVDAADINDRGQIAATGRHRVTGASGALLLTPVGDP